MLELQLFNLRNGNKMLLVLENVTDIFYDAGRDGLPPYIEIGFVSGDDARYRFDGKQAVDIATQIGMLGEQNENNS